MKISILGLGYVGCVSAACLAQDGHQIIGVDVNSQKVALLSKGVSPIVEPSLQSLVEKGIEAGNLRVTLDTNTAVFESDISLICVGTPSNPNGSLNLDYVENVIREVGTALAQKPGYHVIVVRSTVLPGTVQERLLPCLERFSGKKAGVDFGLCMNPEFLREGSAIKDYYNPSYIVIGELDRRSGEVVEQMYRAVAAPVVHTEIKTAEMLKYASNTFHALKVTFANEIGNLCKAQGIDGQEVMEIFCQDHQLNISAAYLKPGFAFGGSCLPKDTRALLQRAKERDINTPILSALIPSNQHQISRAIELVEQTNRKKIAVLGLSFKPNTDDVRESPVIPLIETLVGRGYQVTVYDDQIQFNKLMGANKSYLEQEMPHITSLMCSSLEETVKQADAVVITNASSIFKQVPEKLKREQILIDLVGIARNNPNMEGAYEGICW